MANRGLQPAFAEDAIDKPLPPGWNETHLEAYRDGFTDALVWALDHDHADIEAVLDD